MRFALRCYLAVIVVAAAAMVATLPWAHVQPIVLLALAALAIAVERLSRVGIGFRNTSMSVSLVVTFVSVLTLPPPGAAVVGLATSLQLPRSPTFALRVNGPAMFALAPAAGSAVRVVLTGANGFLEFPPFLLPFFAAVTSCLLVNGMMLAAVLSLTGRVQFIEVWRSIMARAAMPYYASATLALIFVALWHDIGWFTAPLVLAPMYVAHWSLSQYSKEEAAHEGTIAALVQAVEIKDSYTRGHSERVAKGAELLARQLKMPTERVAMLRFAGLLHDIGKLGVPTRLLTSSGGLTEEEFQVLCRHPNFGIEVIRDIRFLTEVYEGVLYHHERLDGKGYPTGRRGDQIPEFARIIGVADAFDAMTSTRSYRSARSVEDAVAELRRGAGTQFDPVLVRAFEDALELAERAGHPWTVSEVPEPEPQLVGESGPWPLPRRVPGFSFADHDDPFVPLEWFPQWYPGRYPGTATVTVVDPDKDGADPFEVLQLPTVEIPRPRSEEPASGPGSVGDLPKGSADAERAERAERADPEQPEGPSPTKGSAA